MRIGVDLGGTKIEAILLSEHGEECARRRVSTPKGDYDATLASIHGLIQELEQQCAAQALVGVGIPGAVSPATGLVKNANSVCLIGHRLQADLKALLRRPIRLANDADCFTMSEATDGAAAGAQFVFGVILGTGVGGGICWRGQLLSGPNAIAGEWGHNPLPWPNDDERPGTLCYCGKHGCIETFLSGSGLEREYFQQTGQSLLSEAINQAIHRKDLDAERVLIRYENRLARCLATVINVLDPDVIVLGGGISNFSRFYAEIPKIWGQWIFSDRVDTKLVAAKHGDSSGVRGAAWLWSSSSG
ncbi:MAG: ROK family protein [Nitrospirales bacterium]